MSGDIIFDWRWSVVMADARQMDIVHRNFTNTLRCVGYVDVRYTYFHKSKTHQKRDIFTISSPVGDVI